MFCDLFDQRDASNLIRGKRIWFLGSSNMRAIYKDLLWLMNRGTIAPQEAFRVKNEESFLNDRRVSNGTLHNGKDYVETRLYERDAYLFFHFLTRLYLDDFVKLVESTKTPPDIVLINSTLWDLTRWGSSLECIKAFKTNVMRTFNLLRKSFPRARIVWKTSLPVSISATGSIFLDEVRCIVPMLPWHIVEANRYAATAATFFNIDTVDLHHHMYYQGHLRVKDGIHWKSDAVRYMTNVVLTHLALSDGTHLPGYFHPLPSFVRETSGLKLEHDHIEARVNERKTYFEQIEPKAILKRPIFKAKTKRTERWKYARNIREKYRREVHRNVRYDFHYNPQSCVFKHYFRS